MCRRLQLLKTTWGLSGSSPISLSIVASCVRLQLRPLPSTGVTRLHRYCEPLRHPSRPSLSLTSCQLIRTAITAGTSRVAYGPLCLHAVANTPAGLMELVRSYRSINFGLPTKPGRVGSCISLFEACSAFTHVTACTLAKSPSDSLHQRLQQFRCLHYCSDCYRVERTSSRTGLTPAVDHHLSRRTRFANNSPHIVTGARALRREHFHEPLRTFSMRKPRFFVYAGT